MIAFVVWNLALPCVVAMSIVRFMGLPASVGRITIHKSMGLFRVGAPEANVILMWSLVLVKASVPLGSRTSIVNSPLNTLPSDEMVTDFIASLASAPRLLSASVRCRIEKRCESESKLNLRFLIALLSE